MALQDYIPAPDGVRPPVFESLPYFDGEGLPVLLLAALVVAFLVAVVIALLMRERRDPPPSELSP